ncbi:hypothetical protein M407DRAFT_28702 [Tulasnella calospora MUT 4182]|uniref:Arrestin-like N-terminal domain-containing protein n=1 Tax=Tulasnella calospora MUT 4182 TaxID=1051891 RepID=A0A0C3KJQ2_9AGAM|nr:hypothetical protein M407DRAFT_28702 [Tulasnella calospora MUT 4182]
MASIDVLPPPPSYSLYPSFASVSASSLPSFASQLRPDEESLQFQPAEDVVPTRHNYTYTSKSMILNLGRKIHGASHPTFGANSEIRGTVSLKDLRNVKQITLKISGKASYLVMEDGFSAYTQFKTVLQHTQTLFSSNSQPSSISSTFPLTFQIPTYAHQSTSHLPPSVHNSVSSDTLTHLSIRLNVHYRIEVEVKRHGLHRHEHVGTEWWYAPRTFALPSRPRRSAVPEAAAWESDVKTPPSRSDEPEWRSVHVTTARSPPLDFALEASYQYTYALGESVPFQILISPSTSSASLRPSDIASRLSFQLMKRVSFELGYTASDVSNPIVDAKIASVVIAEDGSCIASGSVQLPSLEEPSWHISPFVETSYFLNLAFVLCSDQKTYHAEVPMKLTSDGESALQTEGEEAWTRPGRSMLDALEASGHLGRQRLMLSATFANLFKIIL